MGKRKKKCHDKGGTLLCVLCNLKKRIRESTLTNTPAENGSPDLISSEGSDAATSNTPLAFFRLINGLFERSF